MTTNDDAKVGKFRLSINLCPTCGKALTLRSALLRMVVPADRLVCLHCDPKGADEMKP